MRTTSIMLQIDAVKREFEELVDDYSKTLITHTVRKYRLITNEIGK